ncbi:MAG TPA: Ldh family oxidoreductase [Hyphomicrobiaceae bacterium]|nr:Ldh family oxidoreductase [Hyphomicrobiaceae bacterium]
MSLEAAQALVERVLVSNRTSPANARSVARALVVAEACGLKGHGLSRVTSYAEQARCGKIDGFAVPSMERTAPALAVIDAAHGFAYPALDLAVEAVLEPVEELGVAVAGVRRSHHCGAMGFVVERIAAAGHVGLMFANTPRAMAPWGGRRALFGTNPIAFAAPNEDGPPVVVDLSLSKVARGNILAARQRGEPIPEGWALDEGGRPTTDPQAALAGTLLPVGDAKGTALALMVEVLAAGLTGARFAFEASSYLDADGPPPATGQLLIALSTDRLGTPNAASHIALLLRAISEEPGVRLPGRRRQDALDRARAEGVAVPLELLT